MNPHVVHVTPQDERRLLLRFSNGETRVFDVSPYVGKGVFHWLEDDEVFKQARVIAGSVEWPGEIDLSYDTLYLRSTAVTAAAA